MSAIVVIPTYNERENLEELANKILQTETSLDILIVDDNSPDGTGDLADELSRKNGKRLFVLHRNKKQGLGRAYADGFRHALEKGYELLLQMDADMSHDPCELPIFLDRIRGCDLVLGSRYLHGVSVLHWDFKRLLLSKAGIAYAKFITGMPFTDLTSGYKCWRRKTLESIGIEKVFSNGYLFQIEMTYRAFRKQFDIAEIPIVFAERKSGKSKMEWKIIWESIWGVLRLRLQC
jgi:dolichol-phosphate mannosyltransferase